GAHHAPASYLSRPRLRSQSPLSMMAPYLKRNHRPNKQPVQGPALTVTGQTVPQAKFQSRGAGQSAEVAVISNTAGFHALYWLLAIGYCVKRFTDRWYVRRHCCK